MRFDAVTPLAAARSNRRSDSRAGSRDLPVSRLLPAQGVVWNLAPSDRQPRPGGLALGRASYDWLGGHRPSSNPLGDYSPDRTIFVIGAGHFMPRTEVLDLSRFCP